MQRRPFLQHGGVGNAHTGNTAVPAGCERCGRYLGRELTDAEWAEAYPKAAQKLSRIIQLYGDSGGERRQPWYLGKLVQEYITFSILSAYCAMSAQKRPPPKRTAFSPPQI